MSEIEIHEYYSHNSSQEGLAQTFFHATVIDWREKEARSFSIGGRQT